MNKHHTLSTPHRSLAPHWPALSSATASCAALLICFSATGCDSGTVQGVAPDVIDDVTGDTTGDVGADTPVGSDVVDTETNATGSGDYDIPTLAGTEGCPQADHFLDVSGGSAGASYDAPSLNVQCEGSEVVVESNGIPNFTFVPLTPNALTTQDFEIRFPRAPVFAEATSDVPLAGVSAVAVNGGVVFGPTEAGIHNYKDPYLEEILDYCNGHTAPGGVYHFHARPDCLFEDLQGWPYTVVAYALDGFPILSPWMCDDAGCVTTTKMESGWEQVEATYGATIEHAWEAHEFAGGTGLDECNGMTLPDGQYVYVATDTFPYFMGCYRGTPTTVSLGGGGPAGGGGPPGGP